MAVRHLCCTAGCLAVAAQRPGQAETIMAPKTVKGVANSKPTAKGAIVQALTGVGEVKRIVIGELLNGPAGVAYQENSDVAEEDLAVTHPVRRHWRY